MTSERTDKTVDSGEPAQTIVKEKKLKKDRAKLQECSEALSTCPGKVDVSQSADDERLNNVCQFSNKHCRAHHNQLEESQGSRHHNNERDNDMLRSFGKHAPAESKKSVEMQTYVYPEPTCWEKCYDYHYPGGGPAAKTDFKDKNSEKNADNDGETTTLTENNGGIGYNDTSIRSFSFSHIQAHAPLGFTDWVDPQLLALGGPEENSFRGD